MALKEGVGNRLHRQEEKVSASPSEKRRRGLFRHLSVLGRKGEKKKVRWSRKELSLQEELTPSGEGPVHQKEEEVTNLSSGGEKERGDLLPVREKKKGGESPLRPRERAFRR